MIKMGNRKQNVSPAALCEESALVLLKQETSQDVGH
jgi:hypothetical protein